MPLPAAPLLVALATAARIGSKVAIRAGTKLYRGTAKVVKNPKKFSKKSYLMAKGSADTAISETKRHAKFYKKVVSPHGSQFKHLIKNQYIKVNTKGKKTRSNLARAGIYGGIGASSLFGDN